MDFNNFDFSNSSIIKPPTKEEYNNMSEQKLIMIDSRDRNINLYEKNNDFIIELDEPISDVSEIELVSANMPTNSYNINTHNNRLYFFENSITDLSNTYDIANPNLYNNDGQIDKTKIFYIKIIPNNYSNPNSILEYLRINNHYVYNLSTNTITGKIAAFFISYNSLACKYNILIFTGGSFTTNNLSSEYICHDDLSIELNTLDALKNSIIFRGDRYVYNNKTMYHYLPDSAHEIFGFDLNYGFNNEYTNDILKKTFNDYDLVLKPKNFPTNNTGGARDNFNYNTYYQSPIIIYEYTTGDYINREVNDVIAKLDLSIDPFTNISNTIATNKANDYVLLHLPNFPKMTNKISSNNIIQNAYTKLHFGTGTRNIFFGRIKAFTNVYNFNPSIKLSKIHIKITDYNGNPYDFNNSNFTLTFSIMYNRQSKYYNY